ncbi:MAG: T9SS type A sorting domain-containing protein [Bacteroidales bacterium]|nr:T9SS type A sorting domain-containing protein [Bacteroidales bacterium]MCF8403034.1 T9SS type A sorting domain-containing protein [Bacteroidales bacterium]
MKAILGILLLQSFFLLIPVLSFSQIIIESGPEVNPVDMVETILGEGVMYDNVSFQGADISSGIFSNGQSTNLGIDKGIFLTSGAGYIIPGPNTSGSSGVNNYMPGHPSLDNITTSTTYDAAVLEFDIVPESDSLKFRFVFGSEEYDEYSGSTFSDVMGIFISGPNPLGGYYADKNMALVPGTNLQVSCNTINSTTNSEYYIDNTNGLTLEYDGFTTVLTALLQVIPCETYHIKIGVADAGDHVYDTGIFLEENSITHPTIEREVNLIPQGISDNLVEGCVSAEVVFRLPDVSYTPYTLYWDLSESTADPSAYPPGDFLVEIPDSVYFEAGVDSAQITILLVYDALLEGLESLKMIYVNNFGCVFNYDTVNILIEDYIALSDTMSPPTIICEGCEVDLWVNLQNGLPPYSYLWEPGGFTSDTITISPDSTTVYTVNYSDVCNGTGSDSIMVTVLHYGKFESYYFEAALNPQLPWDVWGEIVNDSVYVVFPAGVDPSNLIASFTTNIPNLGISINGVLQESGITPNDFTNPVVYFMIAPGGLFSEWVVIADIETGQVDNNQNEISIYPNPVIQSIFINNAEGYIIELLNSLGKKLLTIKVSKEKQQIDLNEIRPGLYFMKFQKGGECFVRKLVVE